MTLFNCLRDRVGHAVARFAERNEVFEPVSLLVRFEPTKGRDVVNVDARAAARLANRLVSAARLSFLGRPIWAAVVRRAGASVLGVQRPYSVFVSTFPGTKTRPPLAARARKPATAPLANVRQFKFWPGLLSGVLTRFGAMLAPPVLCARGLDLKTRSAKIAL